MDSVEVLATGYAPVKGTRHQPYAAVRLDERGPVGDRAFCVVDEASRRVLRTVQNPSLVGVRTRLEGQSLVLSFPDGSEVAAVPEPSGRSLGCDYWGRQVEVELLDGPHADRLSAYLGRGLGSPVRLAAAPRGGVVFGDPVTLVTRASLADLAGRVGLADLAGRPDLVEEAGRFRATLVLDTGEAAYAEESWTGREIQVGAATVRVGVPIPRCAVIDLDPATGVRNAPLLKTLASYRPTNAAGEPCFGMFARVVRPGVAAAGFTPGTGPG